MDTVLLKRLYMLVFIEHGTRRMHLGGVTANPAGEWTVQQARNLVMSLDERFADFTFLIPRPGIELHRLIRRRLRGLRYPDAANRGPRMNAICERLAGTLRRDVVDRMLILGAAHLRAVLAEYQAHRNTARPHQGIAQHVPDDDRDAPRVTVIDLDTGRLDRRSVLNGLINQYTHAA